MSDHDSTKAIMTLLRTTNAKIDALDKKIDELSSRIEEMVATEADHFSIISVKCDGTKTRTPTSSTKTTTSAVAAAAASITVTEDSIPKEQLGPKAWFVAEIGKDKEAFFKLLGITKADDEDATKNCDAEPSAKNFSSKYNTYLYGKFGKKPVFTQAYARYKSDFSKKNATPIESSSNK